MVRRRLKDALAATIDGMMGNWKVEFASGKSFLLGIVVNDNDTPGLRHAEPDHVAGYPWHVRAAGEARGGGA